MAEPVPATAAVSAELVAIGSELLLGEGVDTNSAEISARLAEIGVDVFRHTTVGDNVERMVDVLRGACARADVVVVTGGLGPTQDDLTRVAVARVAGVALERRPELVEGLRRIFSRRGRAMSDNNLVQADLPVGARVIAPAGTAPGFVVQVPVPAAPERPARTATLYCLPGVPREMRTMLERDVLPELTRRVGAGTTVSRVVRTAGMAESTVAEICAPVLERLDREAAAQQRSANPTIAFLASRGETRVRVTAKAESRAQALALLDPVVEEVVDLLGAGVAGVDDEGVEHAIARQLRQTGWTLAVAESITGGGLAARLVTVAGASDWFRGGLVTYATDAKTSLAGVDADVLAREGPVSEAAAAGLALGARERLAADVGLGIVGAAGPTTQGDVPLGTVIVAVALPGRDDPVVHRLQLPAGARTAVQEFAASAGLDALRRDLATAASPEAPAEASAWERPEPPAGDPAAAGSG